MFRPTNIVLLPALVVALLLAKATLGQHARFWTLPLIGGAIVASYNLYVFHNISGGYAIGGLRSPFWTGLAGILFSPGRGLLIYTPVALFALCALWPGARAARHKYAPLFAACFVFIVLDLIVIAKWRVWWGGYCWGPRLLTELAPPLIVLMAHWHRCTRSALAAPRLRRHLLCTASSSKPSVSSSIQRAAGTPVLPT